MSTEGRVLVVCGFWIVLAKSRTGMVLQVLYGTASLRAAFRTTMTPSSSPRQPGIGHAAPSVPFLRACLRCLPQATTQEIVNRLSGPTPPGVPNATADKQLRRPLTTPRKLGIADRRLDSPYVAQNKNPENNVLHRHQNQSLRIGTKVCRLCQTNGSDHQPGRKLAPPVMHQ